MTDYKWVRNARGKEYAVVAEAFDPEIHEEVEGAEVTVDAYGRPQLVVDEPETPAESAHAEWVEHAASPGPDPVQVAEAAMADPIATYGKEN